MGVERILDKTNNSKCYPCGCKVIVRGNQRQEIICKNHRGLAID